MRSDLFRYYVIATALVCAAGIAAFLAHRSALPLRIRAVQASGSPSSPRREIPSKSRTQDFIGDAPWALSALPECLVQQTVWAGQGEGALRTHLPREAQAVSIGTVLRYNDCSITVRARDAFVVRGRDYLHIPPRTQFFVVGHRLFMMRVGRRAELRAYDAANM